MTEIYVHQEEYRGYDIYHEVTEDILYTPLDVGYVLGKTIMAMHELIDSEIK